MIVVVGNKRNWKPFSLYIFTTPSLPHLTEGKSQSRGDIEMLNILVLKFENKLFSGEVTVGFYELNNSREILDVPNNTILRKKRIGKILTTSIKHLETFHLMREYPGWWLAWWAWISTHQAAKVQNKN